MLLALSLASVGPARAEKLQHCHAEVLLSEALPYAPIGSWLLKATIKITYPHGPAVVSTFIKSSPWQVTVRRGDSFWFDCDRARDAWLVSLAPTPW